MAELCVRTGTLNLMHDRGGTLCPRWSTRGVFGQSRALRATLFESVQASVLGGVRRHDTLRPLISIPIQCRDSIQTSGRTGVTHVYL